ncbi:hypothetical protein PQ465_15565 [Sphingobacterium oryzagri]|uniref:DUF4142 domain-containing protein n=1 Tax=Sphingobacterium oryzagri TaxID=3025669 RepID=A0ABY7WEU2_9SPHI|nr:hypothetical protein [Sphingobacterium sp. KACC 22765]WDF67718.1 hypothetical protein PQ465_15565 [Sphingobacterium sp. KACC 22765]
MKLNTLFVAGICASALLASCNPQTAKDNQLKYTHTSLADGDAYQFFQKVGGKAVYEADYATYMETAGSSSAAVKQLAARVKEFYGSIIPTLDSLAIVNQVDFPIKGAKLFVAPSESATVAATQTAATDSAHVDHIAAHGAHAAHGHGAAAIGEDAYMQHVQHETAVVKDQFQRLSRNTDKGLRTFAEANLEKIAELYKLSGGKEDGHAHH